jgi:peptide-methionine (R)-S-oxide reductase
MKRRDFLFLMGATPLLLHSAGSALAVRSDDAVGGKTLEEIQNNWRKLLPADAEVNLSTDPVEKSPAEWKQALDPKQYDVLREEGTERAGTSPLNDEKRPGVYACAGCGLPLFTSQMKFDSGTGWPSFFTSIPGHLATRKDTKLFFMTRTEYHCVRCGGHQGHVFDDGPKPTGERWCNNGVALRFIPAA